MKGWPIFRYLKGEAERREAKHAERIAERKDDEPEIDPLPPDLMDLVPPSQHGNATFMMLAGGDPAKYFQIKYVRRYVDVWEEHALALSLSYSQR